MNKNYLIKLIPIWDIQEWCELRENWRRKKKI